MEHLLSTDENAYGVLDYCLFALRPLYHLFGKSTRNAGGVICSEMVYNVLKNNGWAHEFSMRTRSLLEKFQHDTRASGTMDRPTFVRAYSWMFIMVQPSIQLTMVNERSHRQISLRAVEIEHGHRAVEFFEYGDPTGRYTPNQAAEVLWDFLQDKAVGELR
jgi:hypothetical protein